VKPNASSGSLAELGAACDVTSDVSVLMNLKVPSPTMFAPSPSQVQRDPVQCSTPKDEAASALVDLFSPSESDGEDSEEAASGAQATCSRPQGVTLTDSFEAVAAVTNSCSPSRGLSIVVGGESVSTTTSSVALELRQLEEKEKEGPLVAEPLGDGDLRRVDCVTPLESECGTISPSHHATLEEEQVLGAVIGAGVMECEV
jgi:hypothetical protein